MSFAQLRIAQNLIGSTYSIELFRVGTGVLIRMTFENRFAISCLNFSNCCGVLDVQSLVVIFHSRQRANYEAENRVEGFNSNLAEAAIKEIFDITVEMLIVEV